MMMYFECFLRFNAGGYCNLDLADKNIRKKVILTGYANEKKKTIKNLNSSSLNIVKEKCPFLDSTNLVLKKRLRNGIDM